MSRSWLCSDLQPKPGAEGTLNQSKKVSNHRSHWPISILTTLSSLVSTAMPLVLVRHLSLEDLGVFRMFFLYLTVMPALSMISGVSSGLSYWAGKGEEGRKAIRVSSMLFLAIASLFLVVMLLLRVPIASRMHGSALLVTLFAVATFCGIASLFYDDAAIATGRVWTGAIFISGFELLRTGAIVVAAVMTRDLTTVLKAHLGVQLLKVTLGYVLAYRQNLFRLNWDPKIFQAIKGYALPVSVAWVLGVWLSTSDQLVLSRLLSGADFALYSVCCLTVAPLIILEYSITRILIPRLSAAFSEGESSKAAELFRRAVGELSYFVLPAVTGMFVFAPAIIELLFTAKYLGGVRYLQLYAFSYLALILPPDAIARAQGDSRWILKSAALCSALNLALCIALILVAGPIGALIGLLLSRLASRIYTVVYMRGKTSWHLPEFLPLQAIEKLVRVCVGLGVVSAFARPFFATPIRWLLIMGPAFAVTYFALTGARRLGRLLAAHKGKRALEGRRVGRAAELAADLARAATPQLEEQDEG